MCSVLTATEARAEKVLVEFTQWDGTSLVASGDATSGPGDWDPKAAKVRVAQRAADIAKARADLVASMSTLLAQKVFGSYENFPLLRMEIDEADRLELLLHHMVVAVHEDLLREPTMSSSLPYIGAEHWHGDGHTGEGTAVAILDTGIRYWNGHFGDCGTRTSPNLANEACRVKEFLGFAHLAEGDGTTNPYEVADESGHGTNCGGISGDVAPGTDLLSLGVFAVYFPSSSSGRNRVYTNDGDCALALDWCVTHRYEYNIVAANLSLGSSADSRATGYCTGWMAGGYYSAFANSRDAGVMAVVAAGNDGVKSAIGPPGCVASAVAVAAGYDDPAFGYSCGTGPVVPGAVTCFSNSNSLNAMVAPGNDIDAGGLNGYSGTSMAAPHVAGIWALYAGRYGNDPAWILNWIRADAVVIPEIGPQQDYLHRYVRVGEHEALFKYDTAVQMQSSYSGQYIEDNNPGYPVEASAEVVCESEACASDTVGDVYLDITIDHGRIHDLVIELEDPDGNTAQHEIEEGGELGIENINSILGSQHLDGIFDDLKGSAIEGTWTLRMWDQGEDMRGYLHRAVLYIDSARVQLDALLDAPEVARPDEAFEVVISFTNNGNLSINSAPLVLELIDDETGEVEDAVAFDPELPILPEAEFDEIVELTGAQGTYSIELSTTGLTPDLYPGLVSSPVDVSITYRTFANFEVDPGVPAPEQEATLIPTSRGLIDSYRWDFGDGFFSNEREPVHAWVEDGEYEVILTVTGPDGSSSTIRTVMVVESAEAEGDFYSGGNGCACSVTGHAATPWVAFIASIALLGLVLVRVRRFHPGLLAAALVLLSGCAPDRPITGDAGTDEAVHVVGPWIALLDPVDPSEGDLEVWVMLSTEDSADCDVTMEVRQGEGDFQEVTLGNPDDVLALASSSEGSEHPILWLSTTDFPYDAEDLQLRAQATCGGEDTWPVLSTRFTLVNFLVTHPHAVLVTEISSAELNIPADYESDYVEITNTTTTEISLEGWTLVIWGSGDTREEYALDGLTMSDGDRFTFSAYDGGVPGAIEIDEQFPWTVDSGGAVAIITDRDRTLDFVRWGGSPARPPEDTTWIEEQPLPIPQTLTVLNRIDESTDTDHASDFCVAMPSPGAYSYGCITKPAPGDMLITELDSQSSDDLVEIYNTTSAEMNTAGWVILWDGGFLGSGKFPLGGYGMSPGERIVLRDNGVAGRMRSGYIMELGENLNIDGLIPIAIGMQGPYGNVVDFLASGGSSIRWMEWHEDEPTPMPGPNTTLSREPGDPDTDSSDDWCLAERNLRTTAPACLVPLDINLVITEVAPGRPDWVEIYNPGPGAVDLSRVYLSHTSPHYPWTHDSLLWSTLPADTLLVVSERDLSSVTGELVIDINIPFSPASDGSAALRDEAGYGIDYVGWGEPLGNAYWPDLWLGLGYDTHTDDDHISIQRFPHTAADTDTRDDWCWAPDPSPQAPNNACE